MAVKKLNNDETAYFCEQLSLMLNAGMDLSDGIEIISEDIDEAHVKAACISVAKGMKDGKTLEQAMNESGAFPEYAVNMVRIGSVTGRLEDVFNGLREYYEERGSMTRTLRSAVLHPLVLLVMMTVVMIVLVLVVVPMFGSIFSQFDSSVNEIIGSTVDIAYKTGMVIMIVLLALIAAAVTAAVLANIPAAKRGMSRFLSVFPLTKGIAAKFSRAKAAKAMSTMISSGLSPDEALEHAERLVDDRNIAQKLAACRQQVLDGEPFAQAIGAAGIFPALYAKSLKIAYTSGSFEQAWKKISEKCSEEADQSINTLISFIEPSIIVVLVTMIGAILLSVMIPLMNIMSVLG